jgi:N-acetylglutamate synthase-like GNAT family acetyltransferase
VHYRICPPEPGDFGQVIAQHGRLYAKEYGLNVEFELLVTQIVARFIKNFDSNYEACWIVKTLEGDFLGSVFLVKQSKTIAKLRLLIITPSARGLGIGNRLVDEVIAKARLFGYKKLVLWTNDVLHAARHIYEEKGFRLIEEKKHHSFGQDLVGQNWALKL